MNNTYLSSQYDDGTAENDPSDQVSMYPSEIHNILSQIPYGEEENELLESISTEISLQLPWTSQLRLSVIQPARSILMPYVWNKIKDIDEDGDPLGPEKWREDFLIRNWVLTRFHMLRDMPVPSKLFRQILNRIDQLVDPTQTFDEVLTPRQVMMKYRNLQQQDKRSQQIVSRASPHPRFLSWAVSTTPFEEDRELATNLCLQLGLDRSNLQKVRDRLDELPLERLAQILMQLECADKVAAQRGKALLLSLLHSRGVDVKLDPLPHEFWRRSCVSDESIESYLSSSPSPNANALVVYLWKRRRGNVHRFAAWLPVEPIVPLMHKLLSLSSTVRPNELDPSIDFFLSLVWEEHHFRQIFEPLLGPQAPRDSDQLKKACLEKYRENENEVTNNRRPKKVELPTTDIVRKVWGNIPDSDPVRDSFDPAFASTMQVEDADSDDDDDDFDDNDDRILLL